MKRNATGQYIGKNLLKIMSVRDLRYTDLDKGRMADFKFCMCNMFLVTDSSDDTTISIIKSQVREYQNKHPDGELVDVLGEKLTPTKQSRKRKVLAETKKIAKSKPNKPEKQAVSKVNEQKADTPSKTLPAEEKPPIVEEQTEEERTYVALAATYKNDKDCKAPPLEGWTSDQMSVTDCFDRTQIHNKKYALSRWLKKCAG